MEFAFSLAPARGWCGGWRGGGRGRMDGKGVRRT